MRSILRRLVGVALASILLQGLFVPLSARAMPVFARQTGMACMTCHAGGQFPELTPFGRNFKLTGYTLGQRGAVPLAVMGVASITTVPITGSIANSPDTRGWIPELFWIPDQHLRLGAQYFKYKRYNGASTNYDGTGRNAGGNDTLFIYLWGAI